MKVKLITILVLAICAVGLVGYISYIGLSNLMTTIEETVTPDHREEDLQEMLFHISEAENSIRIYTITREKNYLHSFYSNIEETENILTELNELSNDDEFFSLHLDSIEQLLQKKTDIQKRLIRLKQDQKRVDVYEEVLTKVQSLERKNAVFDSLEQAVEKAEANLTREIDQKEKEISNVEEQTEEKDKQGFFKRLFGTGKKSEEEAIAEGEEIAEKARQLDTLIAAKDTLSNIIDTLKKEDITKEIQTSLAEIKTREEKIDRELTVAELILTRRDKAIAQKIQEEVVILQNHFSQLDVSQAEEASFFFLKITNLIKIVGSIFSMLFLILVFIVMNDIKVNQRIRKQLEVAKNKAEDLAKAKSDFLSNMSHEIRTPMNAILGFAEQLVQTDMNDQSKKQLNIIQNASRHLLSIINDILDFAKIEAGKIKLEKIAFSIEESAQIVYDTLYKNASDKNLDFSLEIGDNLKNQSVKGDPVRFRQILFNLAGNAIKFTEEGFVKIKIDHDFRHIILQVIDSGIGIDVNSQDLIFNEFDQVSSDTSKKYGGTGLGLAIVKKLVEMQKGSIIVESERDQGTEFRIELPYIPTKKIEKDFLDADQKPDFIFPSETKILIVDDEEYNRMLLESIFSKHHIQHESAKSGNEAIEKFSAGHFDLVLLDLQMNEMDGFETCRRLREEFQAEIPIIAATATSTGEVREKCIASGMDNILLKPIQEKELFDCLHNYLSKITIGFEEEIYEFPAESKPDKKKHNISDNKKDLSQVIDLFQNDKSLALSMTNIYYKNLTNAISEFQKDLNDGKYENLKAFAHKIIPSTRHMGFENLADNLKKLELSISDKIDSENVKEQVSNILTESKEIVKDLEEILNSEKEEVNL